MRSTWRTAYEWAKLLFSLDPVNDPYCIRLVVDQMALRSHQAQHLIDLVDSKLVSGAWGKLPNLSVSLALAQWQLGQADTSRRTLFTCIKNFPWLFNRLFQQLGIDRIPPSVWGSEARTDHERLMTELYVTRAADLWKSPEASSLLIEVAGISEKMLEPGDVDDSPISWDEARHVLLSDQPALVALLPHDLSAHLTSASDPLPPSEDLPSYDADPIAAEGSTDRNPRRFQFPNLFEALRTLLPQVALEGEGPHSLEDIQRAIAESGVGAPDLIQPFVAQAQAAEAAEATAAAAAAAAAAEEAPWDNEDRLDPDADLDS